MPPDFLSNQPLVESYLKKIPSPLAAFSFANIFIWQDFFKFEFVAADGHLCIFASDEAGAFLYLPPLAKTVSVDVVEQCFKRMDKLNKSKGVTRIENVPEDQLAHFPSTAYSVHKKGYEYLYFRRDLVDLKGDAFKSKRNAANHFVKSYQSEYLPFEASMSGECTVLYEKWAEEKILGAKDEIYRMMVEDNRLVHRRVFNSCRDLGLVGRVVRVDGKVAAYTFGYFLNKDTFCDLLEIADPQFKGLATYIFWQLCNDPVLRETKFINVMDDFVPESVNRTKMSFRPAALLPSYTISPKVL